MSNFPEMFSSSTDSQTLEQLPFFAFGRDRSIRSMFFSHDADQPENYDANLRNWPSFFSGASNISSAGENEDANYRSQVDDAVERLTLLAIAEDVEPGKVSLVQGNLEKLLEKDSAFAQQVVQEVYLKNSSNVQILTSLISALAYLSKDALKTQANLIALAAFSHKSPEVKEWSIRAFEVWGDPESVEFLKNHEIGIRWLDRYRLDVIRDLEA